MHAQAPRYASIAVLVLATGALAQAARPLREATSESGAYTLRIEPGRAGGAAPCEAVLLRNVEGSPRGRKRWERPLVNEVAPAVALVRDDGRYVVTLDEFRRGGARHALVIYGPDGGLLRHFLLTDLLAGDDWTHVQTARRAITWLRDAQYGFDNRVEQFTIRLAWGRTIRVDLRSLRLLRDGDEGLTRAADHAVPPRVLALIAAASEDDDDAVEPDATATHTDSAGDDSAESHGPADPPRATPGNSWMDVPIPQPNPADPVNYIAWINQFGRTAGPDAAPLYERAVAWFTAFDGPAELLAAAERGEPEALAAPEIATWLEANQAALDAFRAAARLPGRSWSLGPEEGPMLGVLLPHLAPLRQLARATVLEGRRLAADGLTAQAADYFLDTISAGAHLGQGPTMIENLVGVAMQSLGAEALLDLQASAGEGALLDQAHAGAETEDAQTAARLERARPAAEPDYAHLAEQAELAIRPVRSLSELVRSERAMLLDALQHVFTPAPGGALVPDPDRIRALAGNFGLGVDPDAAAETLAAAGWDATLADANAFYETVELASRESFSHAAAELASVEQAAMELRGRNPLLAEMLPAMARVHLVKTRAEATRRAALLVTHLNAYRQTYGRYPDSLDTLGEREFVVDPFTSTRFDYAREGDSFRLSSRGAAWGGAGAGRRDLAGEVVYWPRAPRGGS